VNGLGRYTVLRLRRKEDSLRCMYLSIKKSVIEQEKYEEWRKDKVYGYRWLVESAFTSIKRSMGSI